MGAKSNVFKDMTILFVVSFSVIVYEVFLPRLFSVILDYNYVFLVISLTTSGLGIGGYLSYYFIDRFIVLRNRVLGILAVSMIAVVYGIYLLSYQGILIYSIVTWIPFLLSGWLIAGIMQQHHHEVKQLYFSDLFGAGLGAVGAIFLMNEISPIQTVGLISLLLFFTYFLLSFRRIGFLQKLVNSVLLLVLVFQLFDPLMDHMEFKAYRTSPHTAFYTEPRAKMVYSHWNAFTRTDVFDADDDELYYITIDGGAVSPISKFTGNLKEVDYLRSTTSFLAFQAKPHGRALIIGAGGGQEVLAAQIAGYSIIEAVDINKASFNAVQETGSLSGNIYQESNVKSIVSDGRSYVQRTKQSYDLIYLSLVTKKSENGLGLALSENYIYTQEAVKEYLGKLTDQGRLAFLLHDDKELNKILYSVEKVLKEEGIPEADLKNHMAIIGTYQHLGHVVVGMNDTRITRPLLIVQNEALSYDLAESLYTLAQDSEQISVHIPYFYDQYAPMQVIAQSQHVNVKANRDDAPFFYHKTSQVPVYLVIALLLVILMGITMTRKGQLSTGRALYFSGLAIGFMLIEVTLVQRLVLPLGHPTLSFVLVLGVLLVAGGLGSLWSDKKWFFRGRYIPLMLIGVFTVGTKFVIDGINESTLSQAGRMLALGLTLIPLGFFMGMPFPVGLRKAPHQQLAVSWGVNGVMTVAGSLLAAIVSLTNGFTATLFVGAAIYALLFSLQPLFKIDNS
jgi:hypothetical protein